jgi:hypothetical protein
MDGFIYIRQDNFFAIVFLAISDLWLLDLIIARNDVYVHNIEHLGLVGLLHPMLFIRLDVVGVVSIQI